MKYLKHFLLLSSFSFILFGADEEEIKTIVIDGVTYKINPASQNITPYDGLSGDNSIAAEVVAMQSSSDTMVNQSSSDVKENKRRIAFENLTMAPIEKDLIIKEKLSKKEKNWLNNYHKTVFKNLIKSMNKTEALELEKACSAI